MTLIEVTISAAIAILMAAAFFQMARGSRPLAASSAAAAFDAAIAFAKSIAATSGNGATLVFEPASPGPGYTVRIYSGRPDTGNALTPVSVPPISSQANVSEAVLGAPPFTVFLDGSGYASGQTGAVAPGSSQAADPGCPVGESALTLTFSDARSPLVRALPCKPS